MSKGDGNKVKRNSLGNDKQAKANHRKKGKN